MIFSQEAIEADPLTQRRRTISLDHVEHITLTDFTLDSSKSTEEETPSPATQSKNYNVPLLNIVMLVVGSHGDVQPFVSIGIAILIRSMCFNLCVYIQHVNFFKTL